MVIERETPMLTVSLRRSLKGRCDAKTLLRGIASAFEHFRLVLPRGLNTRVVCDPQALERLWGVISQLELSAASPDALQNFFMRFGSAVAKSELAQFFTAPEIVDFVVALVNPKPGELVLEIASGTADFLIGADRWAQKTSMHPNSLRLVGIEVSEETAELARLNLFMHHVHSGTIVEGDVLMLLNSHPGPGHAPV
jgi:hypothetical protein